jgi:hypothetical protein
LKREGSDRDYTASWFSPQKRIQSLTDDKRIT